MLTLLVGVWIIIFTLGMFAITYKVENENTLRTGNSPGNTLQAAFDRHMINTRTSTAAQPETEIHPKSINNRAGLF